MPWWSRSRAPPCSRAAAQSTVSCEEALHGTAAAGRDAEPLLDEPGALQLVARADVADDVGVGDAHVGEAQRRVAVRVVVGEDRVVDDGDAGGVGGYGEQGRDARPVGSVGEGPGVDDEDGRDVAEGDEPLLAVDEPAAVDLRGGAGHHARVGAGARLGHGVRVVQLTAQGRVQPARLELGAGRAPDVVGVGDVPADRVGGAAERLLREEPLEVGPGVAAVLLEVEAALQTGLEGGAADALLALRRDRSAGELGLQLDRLDDLLGELGGALGQSLVARM